MPTLSIPLEQLGYTPPVVQPEPSAAGPITLSLPSEAISRGRPVTTAIEETEPKPKSLWVKGVSAALALPKALLNQVTTNIPATIGHISEGDWKAAAEVPRFIEEYKATYKDTGGLMTEGIKGLSTAGAVTGGILQFGADISEMLGYMAAGDQRGLNSAREVADTLLPHIVEGFQKKKTAGSVVMEQFSKLYPSISTGTVNFNYIDSDGKAAVANVGATEAMQWAENLVKSGGQITDANTIAPITLGGGITPTAALAFAADVTDPVMAGFAGGTTKMALNGIRAGLKGAVAIPRIAKTIEGIKSYSDRITVPGSTLGNAIRQVEEKWGTVKQATMRARERVYGMENGLLQSEAIAADIKHGTQVVADILDGKPTGRAIRWAKDYQQALAEGNELSTRALRADAHNLKLVGPGGDYDALAESILRIPSYTKPQQELLRQLALAWRDPNQALPELLEIIKPKVARMPVGVKKAYNQLNKAITGEEQLVAAATPATAEQMMAEYVATTEKELGRKLTKAEMKEIDITAKALREGNEASDAAARATAIQIGDVETIANALSLPRGGMGVLSPRTENSLTRFLTAVRGEAPRATAEELSTFIGANPHFGIYNPIQQNKLLQGLKEIAYLRGSGASDFVLRRLHDALEASARTEYGTTRTLMDLVDMQIAGEAVLNRYMAPGVKVAEATRKQAFATRNAVEKYAESQGIDVGVLRNAVRLGADLDEQIGKIKVDLGLITKEQFDGMKGLHVQRSYQIWPEIEARITELERTNPEKAARLQIEMESFKSRVASFWKANGETPRGAPATGRTRADLTPEFRELLDQLSNYSDALRVEGATAAKNIGQFNLYRGLREAGFATKSATQARLLGYSTEPLVGKGWGALEGHYVSAPIRADLIRYAENAANKPGLMEKLWSQFVIGNIKLALVPLNYAARLHNMTGNFVQQVLEIGEVDATKIAKFHRMALGSLRGANDAVLRYSKYSPSIMDASVAHEYNVTRFFQNIPVVSTVERALLENKFAKSLAKSMSWEEAEGKMMMFHYFTTPVRYGGQGLTDAQAVLRAERAMVDYTNVPPYIDVLRRKVGVFPFITYTYKKIGDFIKLPLKNPNVVASLGKPLVGLKDMYDPKLLTGEKKGLPDYMQNGIYARLPGKDARYINLWPFLPFSIYDPDALESAPSWLRPGLAMLGPPFSTFMELGMNRNKLTGADIVPEGADWKTAAKIRGDYILKGIPQYRQATQIMKAISHNPESLMKKPRSVADVLMTVQNFDIDKGVEQKYKMAQNEYTKAISYATKVMRNKLLTEKQRTERVASVMQMADVKRKEMLALGDNMFQIKGLRDILALSGADPEQLDGMMKWFVNQPIEPSEATQSAMIEAGRGLIPGQGVSDTLNVSVPRASIPQLNVARTGEPVVDMRSQRPNQETLSIAAEELVPPTYPEPSPELPGQ